MFSIPVEELVELDPTTHGLLVEFCSRTHICFVMRCTQGLSQPIVRSSSVGDTLQQQYIADN